MTKQHKAATGTEDTPYESQIEADYNRMVELLSTIRPPSGHGWTTGAGNPLRWFAGNIAESTRFGAGITLQRTVSDDYDPMQLHAEVRIGWDGDAGTELPEQRRAILWCSMGPRINFTSKTLIGATALHFKAPDIDRLFSQVGDQLRCGLQAYAALLPDHLVDLIIR